MAQVTIFQSTGFVKRFSTENTKQLSEARAQARKNALAAMAELSKEYNHLAYSYEMENGNVYIYETPRALTDEQLNVLASRTGWNKPAFIGAIHRK